MPDLAANHPQVVHFAVALLLVGVALRLISLTGRLKFTNHSATTLLVLGTIAAIVSVKSGDDAHGPVERIPGVRALVIEHEDLGKRTRNIFLGVVVIELLALGLAAKASTFRYAHVALMASGAVGIYGSATLYHTAEHGGELVYSYAGGPGLRTGEPADVERLLLAGLYQQAIADRKAGRNAKSLLLDLKDYPAALAEVRTVAIDPTVARFATRKALLTADIFLAMGLPDSARAALAPIVAAFPQNARMKAKLDSIQ